MAAFVRPVFHRQSASCRSDSQMAMPEKNDEIKKDDEIEENDEIEINFSDIKTAFISDNVSTEILKAYLKTHPDSFQEKK